MIRSAQSARRRGPPPAHTPLHTAAEVIGFRHMRSASLPILSRNMSLVEIVCRTVLIGTLIVSCQDSGNMLNAPSDSTPQSCDLGARQCRADGLYTCDASGVFRLTEPCASCEATPVPHCAVSCAEAGVTSICDGDAVKNCATGTSSSCDPGTCLPSGKQAVCATMSAASTCEGRRADGTPYVLVCGDANGVSSTEVCDQRTGTCAAAAFDCAALASNPANKVACDASSGNYYSSCVDGQPNALVCGEGSACASDGSTTCYTPLTVGAACGGPTVCYPGLHCIQQAATGGTCSRPAGQLACNSTDVLAVCNDTNTAVACVNGSVWWWKNLTAWGGSCTNDHVTLAAGGTCIPGLADCMPGLECHRSRYDVAGICRTPEPNAPAECTLTGQASAGLSCAYDWHSCRDGRSYDVDCHPVNVGGTVLTVCDCSVNGTKTTGFSSDAICNVTSTAMLDAAARAGCGWTVTTEDVSPQ